MIAVISNVMEKRLFLRLEIEDKIQKKRNLILNYIKNKTNFNNNNYTVNENVSLRYVPSFTADEDGVEVDLDHGSDQEENKEATTNL